MPANEPRGARWCPTCHKHVPASHFYPGTTKPRCAPHLVWDLARRWKLLDLIERGHTDAQIAKKLGVSQAAIELARRRYAIPSGLQVHYSARDVAEIMGKRCAKGVIRWIEAGALRARKVRSGPHTYWVITRMDLTDFLGNRDFWPGWEIERITDPDLRAYARTVRPADLRYLTVGEAAERLFVVTNTINQWIHKGKFPNAVKYGNWWIPESDLAGVRSPYLDEEAA